MMGLDRQNGRQKGPLRVVLYVCLVLACLGLASANPVLTFGGLLLVPVFFGLLWRVGEPPVLLFAMGYQWLQVFVPVLNANFAGIDMNQEAAVPNLTYAAYLGFAGLLFLALGMRLGLGRRALDPHRLAFREVETLTVNRLIAAYVIAQAVAILVNVAGGMSPGLRQPLLGLGLFRWTVVFVIFWAGFRDHRFRMLAIVLFCLEVGLGLLSYFSAFKSVMFVAIVVALGTTSNPRRLLRPQVLFLAVLVLAFGVFWQSVKVDYREFLRQGSFSQRVVVPVGERVEFLLGRLTSLSVDDLKGGFQTGVERTGYLEYFARATTVVPDRIPYQEGRLWGEAITHIFTPRLFFPEKRAIDDSERVKEFSGVWVAGSMEGTSVSLGYVAESYIDFGPVFMFLPVFALGVFWGRTFRLLSTTGRHRLLAFGFATSFILMNGILFESSNVKIVGGAVTALAVGWVVLRFGGDWIWSIMTHVGRRRRMVRPA